MRHISEVARMWAAEFQVVRLWPGTKIPMDKGYQLRANRLSPLSAEHAWAARPDMNLGVMPGSGGCAVIDLDGPAAIGWFLDRYGPAAFETLSVRSPRPAGGMHLWYRAPEGRNWWRGKLGGRADVDVKVNGFVVVPPSAKFIEGRYRWIRDGKPEPIPDEVLRDATHREPPVDYASATGTASGWVLGLVVDAMAAAPEGYRNHTLFALARDFGPSDELSRAAVAAGLDQEETDRTIESATRSRND